MGMDKYEERKSSRTNKGGNGKNMENPQNTILLGGVSDKSGSSNVQC